MGGRRRVAAGVGLLALMWATGASASVVEALDLPELVRRADVVAVGTVVSQSAHWGEHQRIVTEVRVRVERTIKGPLDPEQTVPVHCLGGTVDGVAMRVPGAPTFETGQRALVFARRTGAPPQLRPVGMSQGAHAVREMGGRTMVVPNNTGLALVERVGGGLRRAEPALTEPRPLRDVVRKLDRLLQTQQSQPDETR